MIMRKFLAAAAMAVAMGAAAQAGDKFDKPAFQALVFVKGVMGAPYFDVCDRQGWPDSEKCVNLARAAIKEAHNVQ